MATKILRCAGRLSGLDRFLVLVAGNAACMTAALMHLARWLAFQLSEHQRVPERPASITFYGRGLS